MQAMATKMIATFELDQSDHYAPTAISRGRRALDNSLENRKWRYLNFKIRFNWSLLAYT